MYGCVKKEAFAIKGLSIGAKALYSLLCGFAGSSGKCWPSVKLQAEWLEVKERSIYRWHKELISHGLIEKSKSAGRSNFYEIDQGLAKTGEKTPDAAVNLQHDTADMVTPGSHVPDTEDRLNPTQESGAPDTGVPLILTSKTNNTNNNNINNKPPNAKKMHLGSKQNKNAPPLEIDELIDLWNSETGERFSPSKAERVNLSETVVRVGHSEAKAALQQAIHERNTNIFGWPFSGVFKSANISRLAADFRKRTRPNPKDPATFGEVGRQFLHVYENNGLHYYQGPEQLVEHFKGGAR